MVSSGVVINPAVPFPIALGAGVPYEGPTAPWAPATPDVPELPAAP